MIIVKALAFLALAVAPAVQPKMVRAQDPQSLVSALRAAGYAAELGTDNTGDPKITSSISGIEFQILFYNCTNHKECPTVRFFAGYHVHAAPNLETINEWNRTIRRPRAAIDKEGDPILEMDVDLDHGGVTPPLFIDNIEVWASALPQFHRLVGLFEKAWASGKALNPSPQKHEIALKEPPIPQLKFLGSVLYSVQDRTFRRYRYEVTNWSAYPAELFAPAPDLPPCGSNTNASRSWVDMYAEGGRRLYGFCALAKQSDLRCLWFAVEQPGSPPDKVYVQLKDRQRDKVYKSNLAPTKLDGLSKAELERRASRLASCT